MHHKITHFSCDFLIHGSSLLIKSCHFQPKYSSLDIVDPWQHTTHLLLLRMVYFQSECPSNFSGVGKQCIKQGPLSNNYCCGIQGSQEKPGMDSDLDWTSSATTHKGMGQSFIQSIKESSVFQGESVLTINIKLYLHLTHKKEIQNLFFLITSDTFPPLPRIFYHFK